MPILLPKPRDVATKTSKETAAYLGFMKQAATKKGKLMEVGRILTALQKLAMLPVLT